PAATDPVIPSEKGTPSWHRGWLGAMVVAAVAVLLVLGAALIFVYVRWTPSRSGHTDANKEDEPVVGFKCDECGKRLKGKAEMAGKKIKCPECGRLTVVPSS